MPVVKQLEVSNWQRACPECGYENGFHVSFRRTTQHEQDGNIAALLICPSCSTVFDVGLKVRLAEAAKA